MRGRWQMNSPTPSSDAARRPRDSALPSLGKDTLLRLFARRHESPQMRSMLRSQVADSKLWLRFFGGAR